MAKYSFTRLPVDGYSQRHPDHWAVSTPPSDATEVIIDPGFPQIEEHFGDLVKKPKKSKAKTKAED